MRVEGTHDPSIVPFCDKKTVCGPALYPSRPLTCHSQAPKPPGTEAIQAPKPTGTEATQAPKPHRHISQQAQKATGT